MVDMISCEEAYKRVNDALQRGVTPSQNDLSLASVYEKNMSGANVPNNYQSDLVFDNVDKKEVNGDAINKYFGSDENTLLREMADNDLLKAKLTKLSSGEQQLYIDNSASNISSVDCINSISEMPQVEYTKGILDNNEIEILKDSEIKNYYNPDSKYDGFIIEKKFGQEEIDDDYKALASHITCLMGLQNGENLSRFGTGSDGYIIFNSKSKGKTSTARYKKLDNGFEKMHIDKGNENFEEQVFDNNGNLREKTVKNGNKEVQEEFSENGTKIKKVTENLSDGSLKITKERKFLDGTVIKSEKILYPDYDKTDQKSSIDFDQSMTKGKYDFVNHNGEKTGESSVESYRDNRNNDKKDMKTAKTTSKSNLKKS